MFTIKDKVVIIPGGASGIGKAIAAEFAREGALVVISDCNEAKLRETTEELGVWGVAGDISKESERQNLIDTAEAFFGKPPQICLAVAGITRDKVDATYEEDRLVIDIDLLAPIRLMRQFAAHLTQKGLTRKLGEGEEYAGIGLLVSSISSEGNFSQVNYAAAKAGLIGALNSFNLEWRRLGMRAYAIHPGFTDTQMVQAIDEKYRDRAIGSTKSKTLFRPEQVAKITRRLIEENLPGIPAGTTDLFLDRFEHADRQIPPYYMTLEDVAAATAF